MKLTQREQEVLDLVVQGFTNKQIAEKLFLSSSTIKTNVQSILRKLKVKNRIQAAVLVTKREMKKSQNLFLRFL